jgi:gliding motility-associated-like protein
MRANFMMLFLTSLTFLTGKGFSQNLSLQLSSTINYICNGIDCDYNGPSILINEVMLAPSYGDGSIYGMATGLTTQGEWIELYNPDKCNSVDISCYFLGNNAPDPLDYPGGFIIPANTIVPPQGFCVIRGINAPAVPSSLLVANGGTTVEIVVNSSLLSHICLGGGTRLWFPNNGGWFAFYDRDGVPQDAISWNSLTNSCMTCQPCNPGPVGSCSYSGSLPSYANIPASRKTYITSFSPQLGFSYRRIPDGGSWVIDQAAAPTMGNCNTICNPPPVITCNGTAIANVIGGLPPYSYQWNDVMNQTTQTATGLCEGIYCVTVTDHQNNTAIACVEVKDLTLNVNASSGSPVCEGTDLYLNVVVNPGGSGLVYEWSGPAGFSASASSNTLQGATPSMSGQYMVTVSDVNECTGADTITVIVHPAPDILLQTSSAHVCLGDTALLTATGAVNYNWNQNLPEGSAHHVTPAATTIYSVTGTDANGCSSSAEVEITVTDLQVEILPANPFVCQGDTLQLSAQAGGTGLIYSWSTGETTPFINISPQTETAYALTVTDLNGCTDSEQTTVIVYPVPSVGFQAWPLEGCPPLAVSFVNLSDSGTYLWNFGNGATSTQTTPSYTYHQSGYFSVSLTVTAFGCDNKLTLADYIYVYPSPEAGFHPSSSFVFEDNAFVSFTDISQGAISWFWDFGTGNSNDVSMEQHPEFTFPAVGTYYVWQYVENDLGCSDSARKKIIVKPLETIYFPNAFTPNGDGINDVFTPFGNGIDPDDYEMLIYDRWGELVFKTHSMNIPWKGDKTNSPGIILPAGVYVYVVKTNFSGIVKIHRGVVTLIY